MKVRDLIMRLVLNAELDDEIEIQMKVKKGDECPLYFGTANNVVRLDEDNYEAPVALIECVTKKEDK